MEECELYGPCVAVTCDMVNGITVFEWPSVLSAHVGMQCAYGFKEHEYKIHVLDPEPLGVAFLME